jgi:hypothetical protein
MASNCAVAAVRRASPTGQPRFTHFRSASNWASDCGRLTISIQSAGRGTGQSARIENPSFGRTASAKLDHGQSSAELTKLARSALRSTYRVAT